METIEKDIVVFSTISKDHDMATDQNRWKQWRPLTELMGVKNFFIRKLNYFVSASQIKNIETLQNDLLEISPESEITPVPSTLNQDFSSSNIGEFYRFFCHYFEGFTFNTQKEDYYFHFGPGNLFLHAFMLATLINARKLPLKILHLRSPQKHGVRDHEKKIEIYDCAVSKWISELGSFERKRTDSLDYLKSSIKTKNHAFNSLIKDIEHVATHSIAPMLFSGPTGSGKSKLARKIYELRVQRGMVSGGFVEINCATLHGASAMSTLFGHVKGSYTGAIINRKGLLRTADNGILFLDEIGELSVDMQVMLLKAIEEKRFIPFGSDTEVNSNFQLICATNQDLSVAVSAGHFRGDLLSRINLWHFELPSLRQRPEDIEPNIDYELQRIAEERGIFAEFLPSARKTYLAFASSKYAVWPNNFRSLLGSLERMITYSFHGVIDDNIVQKEIDLLSALWKNKNTGSSILADKPESHFPLIDLFSLEIARELDLFEKIQLESTIKVCMDSTTRSEAGIRLFSCSRKRKKTSDDTSRLNKYLKSYNLTWNIIHDKSLHSIHRDLP